jgi:hypothetical protein
LKRGSLNIISGVQKRRHKTNNSTKMTMESAPIRLIKIIGTVSRFSSELSEEAFEGGAEVVGGADIVLVTGGPVLVGTVVVLGATAVVVVVGTTEVVTPVVVVGTTEVVVVVGTREVATTVVVDTEVVVVVVVGTAVVVDVDDDGVT